MEHRKNLNKDLRRQSGLFFQIGLLIALMLCVSAFEYKKRVVTEPIDPITNFIEDDWMPPVTDIKPPPPPKPKIANPVEVKNEVTVEESPEIIFDIADIGEIDVHVESEEPDIEIADEAPFKIVEEMPSPAGGYAAFYQFIKKELKYPAQARRMDIEGKVYVKFVVLEDGSLDRIQIARGIGAGCDKEVLRVMKKAPKWNPGKQRGVPVKVWQIVPVHFTLN